MLFPSVEWFKILCDEVNANPDRFRRLGTVDIKLVAKIDYPHASRFFEILFAGYRCLGVREIVGPQASGADAVVLEGSYEAWRAMIENIRTHGQADLEHTLNALTLFDEPLRVTAENQLDLDLFYRYQQNLQEFFDASAKFSTEYTQSEVYTEA